MASIRTDRGMKMHIRYRLIQILEIVLWLGAVAGVGMVARDAWALREQGYSAMLDAAGPGLLAIGAAMAALIVLIGIYHNSRRSAEAMDRMSRQSAGGMRRLPGVARGDAPVPAMVPAPVVAAPVPVAAPVAAPVVAAASAPVAVQPAPVMAAPAPMPVAAPAVPPVVVAAPAPVAPPAPAPVFTTPTMVEPEPAPVTPHVVPANSAMPDPRPAPQRLRAGIRRLGPAS